MFDSQEKSSEEKQMIGKIASEMIEDGDAIFLSPGSTCLEIAKNIKQKRLTVVTNDLIIGYELRNYTGLKVIVTGGDLIQSTSTLTAGLPFMHLTVYT